VDQEWDADCGNGINAGGTDITGNDPADTSTAITPSFVSGWIGHLTGKYGTATNGGVAYYNLDNEPMLWNSTHRDVHPQPTSYDEIRDRTYQYAAAVKATDPSAKTLGPVLWGWCAYFYSAADGCGVGADYQSHGNTPFVPWYLQQMKSYEQQHGVRILDYLDLHNYPAAGGVPLSTAGSASTQALRLRSTRSLWDPTYKDESWISDLASGGVAVQLIPRMKEWVAGNYPGTGLAITEYNWGGLESINGALAQADVLGIFGREGLDLATIWGPPETDEPGAYAFRIYRNYDGAGHGFGDTSVQSASTDQEKLAVYAAQRSTDSALTAVVINKTSSYQSSAVYLAGFTPQTTAGVYRYSPANLEAIEHLADQPLTAGGFTATFPANSITLYVIPSTTSGNRTLTIVKAGSGSGGVSAAPGSIFWNGNTGTASYPDETYISLAAYPAAGSGSAFTGWSGACDGNTNPCIFTITSNTVVNAQFDILTDFTADPVTGHVPLYVCFSDASVNDPASWLWDFGDGETAVNRNPCHGYKTVGSYGVSLTSSGGADAATRTKSGYINASACANQPARIAGSGSLFPNIQSACDNAGDDTIEAQALDFTGGLTLINSASVTLKGGFLCDYSANPMLSTINGPLTISGGPVSIDRIVVR
jgi:PKD repeat protein